MKDITYRGYLITPVFNYTNGRSDWQISKDERGTIMPDQTLDQVKEWIDFLLD